MVTWRQIWNSDASLQEDNLGEGIRQLDDELGRSAAVSRKPIDHPGVGGMVVCLPPRPVWIGFPVRVGEASGVLVLRIARVSVLERRLRKR
jgi:hypothetical protein